jgi:hypothetical protein
MFKETTTLAKNIDFYWPNDISDIFLTYIYKVSLLGYENKNL